MNHIKKNTIRKIARELGIDRISEEALEKLSEITENYIKELLKTAIKLMNHAKRKTIKKEDIQTAKEILSSKL